MTVPPPAHVEPFVRVLGQDLAVDFLLAFGGAELYIARSPSARSRLAQVVGVDKARALAAESDRLPRDIPTAKPWIARVMKSKGLPAAEIARKLHASTVSVRRWLKAAGAEPANHPRQMRLF